MFTPLLISNKKYHTRARSSWVRNHCWWQIWCWCLWNRGIWITSLRRMRNRINRIRWLRKTIRLWREIIVRLLRDCRNCWIIVRLLRVCCFIVEGVFVQISTFTFWWTSDWRFSILQTIMNISCLPFSIFLCRLKNHYKVLYTRILKKWIFLSFFLE